MKTQTFFDAVLLEVCADDHLLFEYLGQTERKPIAPGLGAMAQRKDGPRPFWCDLIGKRGVVRSTRYPDGEGGSFYHFEPYQDQSLRRAFDLDSTVQDTDHPHRHHSCIGWRNQRHPDGFLAPAGLLPGLDGAFVEDLSECHACCVPLEFRLLCERHGLSPTLVLQGFMADAAQLRNYLTLPRADGLNSNGSDERLLAGHYLERTYGMAIEEAVQ